MQIQTCQLQVVCGLNYGRQFLLYIINNVTKYIFIFSGVTCPFFSLIDLCSCCFSGAPLFDSSCNFTDPQTMQLLQHSQRLLSNLSTIFHCLLSEAQELTQKGASSQLSSRWMINHYYWSFYLQTAFCYDVIGDELIFVLVLDTDIEIVDIWKYIIVT